MKKLLFVLFAAVALMTACSQEQPDGTSFKKGEAMTLTLSVPGQTKATSSMDSDSGIISFKWESDDAIKVSVGTESAIFTLSKLIDGGGSAEFSGTMPADGNSFDIQFPAEDPVLANQFFMDTEVVPHNMVKFTATNCPVDFKNVTLAPESAVLRLNLFGAGKNVSRIVVTNTATLETYTLNVNPAVSLPASSADAIPFMVVIPAGTYNFKAEVFDDSPTPVIINSFQTAAAQEFLASQVLSMTEKEVISDLSCVETANCYIVSKAGRYMFKTVQGNTSVSVGTVASAEVLWESFGTSTAPAAGELINPTVSYANGYITFNTADTFREGNAVIAAKDGSGNILWSWHIWLTVNPAYHIYNQSAGTMMDRNLGATSTTKGDVSSLGLFYQWGRKDPFLGADDITSSSRAASTGTWSTEFSEVKTVAYSIQNPTVFINPGSNWTDDSGKATLWDATKTKYDPCPAGYRVPTGWASGVWATAFNSNANINPASWDDTNCGMDFGSGNGLGQSCQLGTSEVIWYPAARSIDSSDGPVASGSNFGSYWSCTAFDSNDANDFHFYDNTVCINNHTGYSAGQSVRCVREQQAESMLPGENAEIENTERVNFEW